MSTAHTVEEAAMGLAQTLHASDYALLFPSAPGSYSFNEARYMGMLQAYWNEPHLQAVEYDQLRVSRVQHLKYDGGVGHEYVLFHVSVGERPFGFLKVDRCTDNKSPAVIEPSPTPMSSTISIASINSVSCGVPLEPLVALDHIRLSNNTPFARFPVQVVRNCASPQSLRLHHIAAAMKVASSDSPYYTRLTAQCYWYAAVIYGLVVGDDTQLQDGIEKLKKGLALEVKETPGLAGVGHGIRWLSVDNTRKTVERLRAAYLQKVTQYGRQAEGQAGLVEAQEEVARAQVEVARAQEEADTRVQAEVARAQEEVARAQEEADNRVQTEAARAQEEVARVQAEAGAKIAEADAKVAELERRLALLQSGSSDNDA